MSQNNSMQSDAALSAILGTPCSRKEALEQVKKDPDTYRKFLSFPTEEQEKVLSFIAGQRGLKITYDSFFERIMSPLLHPERPESLLSELLGEPVHIESVLPKEGIRLSYEASLIIMDILVKLSDGSRVNVEIQKIGLRFPGERSSCYETRLSYHPHGGKLQAFQGCGTSLHSYGRSPL